MKNIVLAAVMILALMSLTACLGNQGTRSEATAPVNSESGLKAFKLTVPNADCISTGAAASTLLEDMDGVSDVEIDIDAATASIKVDTTKISLDELKKAMAAEDLEVTAVEEIK